MLPPHGVSVSPSRNINVVMNEEVHWTFRGTNEVMNQEVLLAFRSISVVMNQEVC